MIKGLMLTVLWKISDGAYDYGNRICNVTNEKNPTNEIDKMQ